MYKKGDFHLHTWASDGKLSPKNVVALAKVEGVDILAITDHDNTNGIEEALLEGTKLGIKIIPGIELSTVHNGESIHVLGYFRNNDYKNEKFQLFLSSLQEKRLKRAKQIVDNLYKIFDITISYEKIINDTKGLIARPHLAKAIIDAGYPYDWQYIFDNIINKESPAYVPTEKIAVSKGISILKEYGALVSLAHPTLIKKTPIEELLKLDFDALEGIYPLNKGDGSQFVSPNESPIYKWEELKFRKLAKEYNKILTAGSDYHGLDKNDQKHGYIGSCPLIGVDLEEFLGRLISI
jgi:predicted metal-dependent phosphoesterase TrpH